MKEPITRTWPNRPDKLSTEEWLCEIWSMEKDRLLREVRHAGEKKNEATR